MLFFSQVVDKLRKKARNRPFGGLGALALALDYYASRKRRYLQFSSCGAHEHIVRKAVTALEEFGFFAIEDFFTKQETEQYEKILRSAISNHPELIHPSTPYDKRLHGIENLDETFKFYSNHKLLHEIARNYHREPVGVAFTLGALLEATTNNPGSGGGWHRDNTVRQFKTMVYLRDVGLDDGPFQIIEKSHHFWNCVRDNRIMGLHYGDVRIEHADIMRLLDSIGHDKLHTLTGKAGTVLIFDPSAIHRGYPIKRGERLALTNYFFPLPHINAVLYEHFRPVAGRSE